MAVAHLEVCGVVQGVGFRWFTVQAARRGGIRGWVRNRKDGCVEIAASGEASALDHFLKEVKQGPPAALVRSVRELSLDALDSFGDEFEAVR